MVRVAPIKLQVGPKVLWFDPTDLDIRAGDDCIVNTSRGLEYGIATSDVLEVSDELIKDLKSPLKPVERLATPEDREKVKELEEKSASALSVFKEIALETDKDMHPVLVEFLFEGDKAVFYFEAEERIDFRELVRKLASYFHVRVDMRQIGVRDGARIIGGLGHCGQELCCARFGSEFSPVSIRMAKEQNLSLNPQKISGVCGRLMCCLRYEYETYKEFNSRAPKMGAKVETPEGIAKVTDINVPSEQISLTLEDGTVLRIALKDFETPEEGRRPHRISEEVYERYVQKSQLDGLGSAGLVDVVNFSGDDIPAQSRPAAPLNGEGDRASEKEGKRRRRRRNRSNGEASSGNQNSSSQKNASGKKSSSGDKGGNAARGNGSRSSGKDQQNRSRRNKRPQSSDGGANTKQADQNRRSNGSNQNQQKSAQKRNDHHSNASRSNVRPGQKSSGLSTLRDSDAASSKKSSRGASGQTNSSASAHRKSRRRSHTTGGENNDSGES